MRLISTLTALIIVFSVVGAQAQQPQMAAEASLEKHITDNRSAGVSGGYATADTILWIGYSGYRDLATKKPVDPSTSFRAASIVKSFTAVAVMQLYEAGKFELDQPISEYLPDFPIRNGSAISVKHLLEHSSGIGDYESSKESETEIEYATLKDAIAVFGNRELKFVPGSDFYYTTYGYVALGWVIEQLSQMTYEDYIEEHILKPAGMNNTGVEKIDELTSNESNLYTQKNRKLKKYSASNNKIKASKRTSLSNRTPGGGFYTTVEDLLKFGQAILNNKLISETTLNIMVTDSGLKKEGNAYGMGWFLYDEDPKYGKAYGHSGGQTGASSQLLILPEAKRVVAILSNTSHTWAHVGGIAFFFAKVAAASNNKESHKK